VSQVAGKRIERLDAIVHLIESESIESQESLVERLASQGFVVTQSSISRDLRELQVGKVRGRYVVTRFETTPIGDILSASTAGANLIVLRTPIGTASMVAFRIDQAEFPEIIGTLAGDDTVFLATENEAGQRAALARLGVKEHV
jgi:transcriptional regulator of arginine metabolism